MKEQFTHKPRERLAILRGVDQLADAVKGTLGPKGCNVALEKKFGAPIITKDGVTVAKEIELNDPLENMGAQMVREVVSMTSDVAGDGTTTATVLAQVIFREGVKALEAGANPMALKRGIDRAVRTICGYNEITEGGENKHVKGELDRLSKPVEGAMLAKVGAVSANNEKSMGAIIAEAVKRVGTSGVIIVEESATTETTLEMVEGIQFDRGYLSPYFVTDPERMECVLEDARILIYEKKITAMKDLLPLVESIVTMGKPLFIIAEDVEGEALAVLVLNKLRGTLKCAAVKAPSFGERNKAMLEDIAILTGGKAVTEDLDIKFENVRFEDLGRAKKIIIGKSSTTIIEGSGKSADIEVRVKQLRTQIEETPQNYDREKLQERLAKLVGGVARIKVGAATETEMKEKKAWVEDAVYATQMAVEEGIVPGGGVALVRCLPALDQLKAEGGEQVGINIVRQSLEEPLRVIAQNGGHEGGAVVEKVRSNPNSNFGFNAQTETFGDMVEEGIIDPTKVVRAALQNAASIASTLLMTEAAAVGEMDEYSVPEMCAPPEPSMAAPTEKTGAHIFPAAPAPPAPPTAAPAPPTPAPEGEPPRFTDVTIYDGHLYTSEDLQGACRLPDALPLVIGKPYTLEVAIRRNRTGIGAKEAAPHPVENPRQDQEDLTIYILARPQWPGIKIKESFAKIKWPYNKDSEPALFRLDVETLASGWRPNPAIEVRIFDGSLDLLDIVQVLVSVVPEESGRPAPVALPQRVVWPDKKPRVPLIDPRNPLRSLSIDVSFDAESLSYRFLFKFLRNTGERVEIPGSSTITDGDLKDLLVKVRNFWTDLAITNYASELSVTASTFDRYLNGLRDLGMQAWLLLFGDRYAAQAGASETIGNLLAALEPKEGTLIQIVHGSLKDFVFPWSILHPPTADQDSVDPLQFWGARYKIEQVRDGPERDVLDDVPIGVIFALDRGFGNAGSQEKLLLD